jgi:hypothetical protein
MWPPVSDARDVTVPTACTRAPLAVGTRQSTPVSTDGDVTCEIGRSDRDARTPGTTSSSWAALAADTAVEWCNRPV